LSVKEAIINIKILYQIYSVRGLLWRQLISWL